MIESKRHTPIAAFRRIFNSIVSHPVFPSNDSEIRRFLLRHLIFHFRPHHVHEQTLRFFFTWGLGGISVLLVLLQMVSGILLKFVYEPTPVGAYTSIQVLMTSVPFGRLIRNLHHWSAHLLVIVIFLHMLRVFFTGAFHPPRQFNWLIGISQFAIILFANFTGYLLPWDQLTYWAITVSTGMLEYIPWGGPLLQGLILNGTELGPSALKIFFALHTAVIPVLVLTLMGFHFWRIRKAGGLVILKASEKISDPEMKIVSSIPNLFLRETTTAIVVFAGMLLFCIFVDAPLGDPVNTGLSPNPTKAPWYFGALQELLLLLHPVFAICIIPLMFGLFIIKLPYLSYEGDTWGVWFFSKKGRRMALWAAAISSGITPPIVLLKEKVFPSLTGFFLNGVIPFTLLLLSLIGFYGWIRHGRKTTKSEAIQALFVIMMAVFGVLTVINVWFRGPGMTFIFPL